MKFSISVYVNKSQKTEDLFAFAKKKKATEKFNFCAVTDFIYIIAKSQIIC